MDNTVSENVESLDMDSTTMKTPNDFDNKLNSVVLNNQDTNNSSNTSF